MSNSEDEIKKLTFAELTEMAVLKDHLFGLEFDETPINKLIVEVINETIKEVMLIHNDPPEGKIWVGAKEKETLIKISDMFVAIKTVLKFAVRQKLIGIPYNMN